MSRTDAHTDRWARRPLAGLAVRVMVLLIPFALSLSTVVALGRLIPRPHGASVVFWYIAICGSSWCLLWVTHRILTRLLPLAALLEMALIFPERAPSRTDLARRAGSNRELRLMFEAPDGEESVQQAAERVLALVGMLARHDRRTRGHAERVRALTDLIAERMGLSEANRDRLRWAALLHDIGKLRISANLLNKNGKPTPDEWKLLKLHPEHGARIIAPLMHWLNGWGDVVAQHHERWDGTGYPRGLTGTRITLGARIVAVADAYDVMTSNRAYKKSIGRTAALRELVECSGSQFDPTVVRAMLGVSRRRLVGALGPLSWVTGLPFVGQTTAMVSAFIAQAGTAVGAAIVTGVVALAPVSIHHHPAASDTASSDDHPTAGTGGVAGVPTAAPTPGTAVGESPAPRHHHHHSGHQSASRSTATTGGTANDPGAQTTPTPATSHPSPTATPPSAEGASGAESGSGTSQSTSQHATSTPTPVGGQRAR